MKDRMKGANIKLKQKISNFKVSLQLKGIIQYVSHERL